MRIILLEIILMHQHVVAKVRRWVVAFGDAQLVVTHAMLAMAYHRHMHVNRHKTKQKEWYDRRWDVCVYQLACFWMGSDNREGGWQSEAVA